MSESLTRLVVGLLGNLTIPAASVISTLLGERLARHADTGQRLFMESVRRQLTRLHEKTRLLESATLPEEDVAEIARQCVWLSARTLRQERIDAAAAILLNPFLQADDPAKRTLEDLDFFVRSLDQISLDALRALGALRPAPRSEGESLAKVKTIARIAGMNTWATLSACQELMRFGFAVDDQLVRGFHAERTSTGRESKTRGVIPMHSGVNFGYAYSPRGLQFRETIVLESRDLTNEVDNSQG